MTRRNNLADLIGDTHAADLPAPTPPGSTARKSQRAESAVTGVPRYLTLERKEARLGRDQADQLSHLTRHLNRARGGTGERITDNTLIRVAVDLLLARTDELAGSTETELRNSVGL